MLIALLAWSPRLPGGPASPSCLPSRRCPPRNRCACAGGEMTAREGVLHGCLSRVVRLFSQA
ncbi:hypothetical protein A4R35_10075 [Thermogemmatispora tikiterensis]|uniref:Uncharacterized protein n=1 Tax=Thermogemmatispora tikiterensis TaxID=1825093 RepID=A0A328VJV0_9CHLR|nr:hypothetical protein A4R35_10075 [Thermogemmatispora tikiterensis]